MHMFLLLLVKKLYAYSYKYFSLAVTHKSVEFAEPVKIEEKEDQKISRKILRKIYKKKKELGSLKKILMMNEFWKTNRRF
jgi:uncharacterized protein Yka (UPF0111/DUF47 family)